MDKDLGQEFCRDLLAPRDLFDLQRLMVGPMQGKFQQGAARVINFCGNFHMGLIITELIVLVKYRLFYAIVNDFFADGQQSLHFRMAWDILLIR